MVTKNTSQNRKILKGCGLEEFAIMKKRNTFIAIHIPKGVEIRETEKWVRTMDKIQKWKDCSGKQIQIKAGNFQKIAGTSSMQAIKWKIMREKEIEKALEWMNDVDNRTELRQTKS